MYTLFAYCRRIHPIKQPWCRGHVSSALEELRIPADEAGALACDADDVDDSRRASSSAAADWLLRCAPMAIPRVTHWTLLIGQRQSAMLNNDKRRDNMY
jgi:hypothetical protein